MNFLVKKGQSKLQAILSGFEELTQELSSFLEANTAAQGVLQAQLDEAIREGEQAHRVLGKLEEFIK